MSLNLNDIFNNPNLVKGRGKGPGPQIPKQRRAVQPNYDFMQTSENPWPEQKRRTRRPRNKLDQYPINEDEEQTGGFARLQILNEVPTNYPIPPLDPKEEEMERNMRERSKKQHKSQKKLKDDSNFEELHTDMNLQTPIDDY